MEVISLDVEFFHFFVGYFYSGIIGVGILHGRNSQSCFGCRMVEKLQHHLIGNQSFRPPIDGDKGKKFMFDSIPFTGSWRIMAHMDYESCLVGQLL